MSDSSIPASVTHSPKAGWWQWLLRITGLEAWFRQAPAATHAGREERILLLLALAGTTRASRSAHATLLASAGRECQAAIGASGGVLLEYEPGTLLLTWPASGPAPVAVLYTQLRDCARRLAGSPTLALDGAAGLGWVAPGAAAAPRRYEPASLRMVAGLLHESQRLGSNLLLTAALHQQLAPTVAGQCTLHVALEVPGHRYPATVYQVAAAAATPATKPVAALKIS